MLAALWLPLEWAAAEDDRNCLHNQAGSFSYYKLALSRAPEWCIANARQQEAQCRYEFFLHGLWPQCERGYPERCKVADYELLDPIDERALLAVFTSRYAIQYQWDLYGSCTGLSRSAYFDLSLRLYHGIRMPDLPPGEYTEPQLLGLIAQKNQGLIAPEMIELVCDAGMDAPLARPNTLDEVLICFDRAGAPMPCLERSNSCLLNSPILIRALGQ